MHKSTTLRVAALATLTASFTAAGAASAQTVFSDNAADTAGLSGTVDSFRDALGALNAPAPENNPDGRRQINWDAAPAAVSAPNAFPGDFFNFTAAPRARGIEFSTPGTGFQLSGNTADGSPIEFENIDPSYPDQFSTFSPERLFTPINSFITDVHFFDPADPSTPATTDGLGVVFTDVELADSTFIDFYDINGELLLREYAPEGPSAYLSFVGVKFDSEVLYSARIYSGNAVLGGVEDLGVGDLVVMDDFIFGEPLAVPEPTSLALLAVAGLALRRRRA